MRGSSLEFAEYRKYVPGDDTRRLDWRAYARSDRFFIKEFEADTNLRLCFVLDTSGSMNFSNGQQSKLEYARKIVGTLAFLASQQGDAVGLMCAGLGFHNEVPPKRNATHLKQVLDEVAKTRAQGETGLVAALHEAAEKIKQRAVVVIVSDLFVDPAELGKCFQHLRYRNHDVVVFHLLEQSEIDFDFSHPMRFTDLEGGEPVLADPSVIATEYRKSMKKYLQDMTEIVRDAVVDYHRVSIDQDYGQMLSKFLLERAPKRK